jgi:hypothetical protein
MSVNQVVLLGKLISKKESESLTRAVIETDHSLNGKTFTQHNFVVCQGQDCKLFNTIEIGKTIFISGSIYRNDNKVSEVLIKHFEVPNKN